MTDASITITNPPLCPPVIGLGPEFKGVGVYRAPGDGLLRMNHAVAHRIITQHARLGIVPCRTLFPMTSPVHNSLVLFDTASTKTVTACPTITIYSHTNPAVTVQHGRQTLGESEIISTHCYTIPDADFRSLCLVHYRRVPAESPCSPPSTPPPPLVAPDAPASAKPASSPSAFLPSLGVSSASSPSTPPSPFSESYKKLLTPIQNAIKALAIDPQTGMASMDQKREWDRVITEYTMQRQSTVTQEQFETAARHKRTALDLEHKTQEFMTVLISQLEVTRENFSALNRKLAVSVGLEQLIEPRLGGPSRPAASVVPVPSSTTTTTTTSKRPRDEDDDEEDDGREEGEEEGEEDEEYTPPTKRQKAKRWGTRPPRVVWSKHEDRLLRIAFVRYAGVISEFAAEFPGRTEIAIRARAQKIGAVKRRGE